MEIDKKIMEFAKKCAKTNSECYSHRNQMNETKIIWDIYYGKLAEEAVYNYYRGVADITKVDYNIYDAKDKNYDADLPLDGKYKLHVKGITKDSADKFGTSWMFQKDDPVLHTEDPNDLLVLCLVTGVSVDQVDVLVTLPAMGVVTREPRVARLKESKVCVYYKDLKD